MTTSSSEPIKFNHVASFSIAWMKARLVWFVISISLLGLSLSAIYFYGFNTTLDFNGGTLIEVGFKETPDIPKIRQTLSDSNFQGFNVQLFGQTEAVINMPTHETLTANEVSANIKSLLSDHYGSDINFRRVETVGPKIGDELIQTSTIAVLVSIAAMLLYIWVRFELPFALGSVVALMHDVIITLGFLAFFKVEFGLPIVAALLTIVGYSMNDTVVIYDRIRENLIKYQRAGIRDIIDLSINEVFTRTMVTSGTTLIALLALLIFGGSILRPFILTITIGVVVGTYSSIFVASPFLLLVNIKNNFKKQQKQKNKKTSSLKNFSGGL